MLEFIINTGFLFAVLFLSDFAIQYYVFKESLKKSVELGLCTGITVATFITVVIASGRTDQIVTDYQLIVTGIALGIAIFSLKFVFGYYVFKRSLKESVKDGLIKGGTSAILLAILLPILVKSIDFLFGLIV